MKEEYDCDKCGKPIVGADQDMVCLDCCKAELAEAVSRNRKFACDDCLDSSPASQIKIVINEDQDIAFICAGCLKYWEV